LVLKNLIMKTAQACVGAILLAPCFAFDIQAQNVGIGVSGPTSMLSVNGTTSSGGLAIGDSTYTSTPGTVAPENGALIEGLVGIGLTTPQVPLHVDGQIYSAGPGATGLFWNGTANEDGVQINPGWIGIQRNTDYDLHLSKAAGAADGDLAGFYVNGSGVGSITTNGTSVSYNTTSDLRLKENVRPTTKGLSDVMRIQVSDFNFKLKPGTTETGFIAQQLYTVLPEVVTIGGTNPAAAPWMVDYGRVTPLLTKAIQEQQSEIESLKQQDKNQDAAFKAENAKLESENAQLKAENAKLAAIAAKVQALEQVVTTMQQKEDEVRTAALER
jgi:hypothetical protein